jgi:endonuclease-8
MPEGDSLYQAARLLQPVVGQRAVRVAGSAQAAQRWASRLSGRTVESIESRGKHLLIHFAGDLSVRTHLGMTGHWHLYVPGERWRKSPGKARLVIETAGRVAVCFAAPDVSAGTRCTVEAELSHLGPDLLGEAFDPSEVVPRAGFSSAQSVADFLLDQQVMAGVGNVYKSEILFLERIHPRTPPSELGPEQIERVAARARKLLWANRSRGTRNTTGYGRRADLWVYGRARRPCRRCGANIESADIGALGRSTYWCPRCQPAGDDLSG